MNHKAHDNDRLRDSISNLNAAIRAGQSGEKEIAALTDLVAQLRDANQHLVVAAVRSQVLQEEAETRNRQQNEFLAMLAHELRNPLAPIGNAAHILSRISGSHPLLPQIHGIISRQVEHLARLTNDLLDASRITSGKIELRKQAIHVAEVINRSIELVKPAIDKRHQHLIVEHLSFPVPMDGDIVRLAQALSNVLFNASKYTPEGGQIWLSVESHADATKISVRDSGIGIEPDLLPHVFELFTQGRSTLERSEGGLGIGLSVAKRLIEMHGGRINVQSGGEGLGAEFTIHLPTTTAQELTGAAASGANAAMTQNGRRILLIEDNEDSNETLSTLLELDGHQVTSAFDGISGIAAARENPFEVVICDIGLPGIDGYGVIAQIRREANQRQPFTVALSGYGQPEDMARALEAGFDQYVIKPVKIDHLLHLIASHVHPV